MTDVEHPVESRAGRPSAVPCPGVDRKKWQSMVAEYGDIGGIFDFLITSEASALRMQRTLWKIYNGSYGGEKNWAALNSAVKDIIPYIYRLAAHLVTTLDEFDALSEKIPEMLRALPYETEQSLDGYWFAFDYTDVREEARRAQTLELLLDVPFPPRRASRKTASGKTAVTAPPEAVASLEALVGSCKNAKEELTLLGTYLTDETRGNLHGKLVQVHGATLAPVIRRQEDLQGLLAVLRDARAWHELTGDTWPDVVISRAVEALTAPGAALGRHLPPDSRLARLLMENPVQLVRFLALPDPCLLRLVRESLPAIDPMVQTSQDARAFVDLLVTLVWNEKTNQAGFLGALPEMAAAAALTTASDLFVLARELVTAGIDLRDTGEWLPCFREVASAVPAGVATRFQDVGRLLPCGAVVGHCIPLLAHGIAWPEIRDGLLQMWVRLRANTGSDALARNAVTNIFAREMPAVTTRQDFATFCGLFPVSLLRPDRPFFTPRFSSDPLTAATGVTPASPDMEIRMLEPFPPFACPSWFTHVAVWWNGSVGTLTFEELARVLAPGSFAGEGEPSGKLVYSVLELAREKFDPAGNDAGLELAARTLGISRRKLQELWNKQYEAEKESGDQYEYR